MFPDVPGCVSGGGNFKDCMRNAAEALATHFASMAEDGDTIPEPSELLAVIEENGNLAPADAAEMFGVYSIKLESGNGIHAA
jgi:predicted RNase H-like HicB family nuclease